MKNNQLFDFPVEDVIELIASDDINVTSEKSVSYYGIWYSAGLILWADWAECPRTQI